MFAKLTRSLIALGLVFVAYQAYALVVVPLLEPTSSVQASRSGGYAGSRESPVLAYQQLLANYFPQDHWTLTGKPKVIETGQLMLVIEDYVRDNRGRVDLTRCVVLAFPTRRSRAEHAPRDAVLIEAPGGAKLEFDQDFNPARGKIGRIVRGIFPGEIVIRSDMRQAGAADDLLIRTRDLQMNETRIVTQNEVEFRLGGNRGSGRNMVITLLEEEHKRPGASGLKFNGLKDLEVFQVHKLELDVGKLDLGGDPIATRSTRGGSIQLAAHRTTGADAWAGGETPSVYAAPAAARMPATTKPPLEVTCDGSFLLSFLDFTATFNDNVVATQLNLAGQSDQLTCNTLKLHFSRDHVSPETDPDLAGTQRSMLSRLEPTLIQAIGAPARIDSPSREAFARAGLIQFDLTQRLVTLRGGAPNLVHGANQVVAPEIRYQHPAENEPAAIGRLWLAGPGSLRISPRADQPQQVVNAQWNAAPGVDFPLQLTRIEGRPVLLVEGRPQITGTALGRLTSDRFRVALRETTADGKDGAAIELGKSSPGQLALLPERIDAVGAVRIDSPELEARTSELTLWVRPEELSLQVGDPRGGDALGLRERPDGPRDSPKRYVLASQTMQMDLELHGRRATPSNLVCTGGVRFAEVTDQAADAAPLSVAGQRMKVNNLRSGSVQIEVLGAVDNAGQQSAMAEIVAKGLSLRAAKVNLDQKANRLWADGVGNAQVQASRDLFGQDTGAATDLHLRWREGLNFDGRRIVVHGEVVGDAAHDWVRCDAVTAVLTQPIDFTRSPDREIEIAEIRCEGGVAIDHRGRDEQGQRSHEHAIIEKLSINRITGAIQGQGPGWVRSVRLAKSGGALTALAPHADNPRPAKSGLDFLRVNFLRGVSGNLNLRMLSFEGDVQAVHGPVLAWEQELQLNPPGGNPAGVATLRCDKLTVNEDPLVGLTGSQLTRQKGGIGPIELHAQDRVQIRGADDNQRVFTAYASTASYSQSKAEFVLLGDKRSPATLYLQQGEGGPRSPWQANSLTYWPETGKVKIGEFQQGSVQGTSATAPRTTTAPLR